MNRHDQQDPHMDAREWQAQERALREERLNLAGGDRATGYRRVARALRAPIPMDLPADFARQLARQAGVASLDLRLERWLLLASCVVLAVAVPAALARYGATWVEVAVAVFPALSQAAPGWLLALGACVVLNGLVEPLGRRRAAR